MDLISYTLLAKVLSVCFLALIGLATYDTLSENEAEEPPMLAIALIVALIGISVFTLFIKPIF